MNSLSFKKILIIALTSCPVITLAQDACDSLEARMQFLFQSQYSFEEAKEIFEAYSIQDCSDKLLAYNFMGFTYYNSSEFDKAKIFLVKGENEFFDKEDNPLQFAINQLYTALILIVENDFESALYHLKKAEKYSSRTKIKFVKASIYQNIGLANTEMGRLEEAEEYYDRAINLGGLDSLNIGYVYQNLAFLNLKKNDTEVAHGLINKTKLIWEALDYHKGKYLLSFLESKLSIKNHDFHQALAQLEYGRAVYQVENKLLLGENYLLEAQIQDSIGNDEAMILALENAILRSDDLSEAQLQKAISDLTRLQDDAKTIEVLANLVADLKAQNINQKSINVIRNRIMDSEFAEDESTINNQLKYLLLLSALSLLLLSLFLRLRKRKSDIQNLNESLELSTREIENQVRRLEEKNKELEEFAYVTSHDLKSPLRTISTFAGLLRARYSSTETDNYLDIISKSAQSMYSMISELLRHSTLDQNLNLQSVNLQDLIEETIQGLNGQISESQARVIIDNSCNQLLQCDKTLFKNVFQNLISNSIKYCKDEEPPEVRITAFQTGKTITIQVSDNGIGMKESSMNQIFEMFKRLKIKDVEGTGIGLATCKKIIDYHQGTISVDSTPGEGSTFTITLPFNTQYLQRNP